MALGGSASYTIPKVDVLVSAVVRSRPEALLGGTPNTVATWQVPNSIIQTALSHLPPGATATGTTNIPLACHAHPLFSHVQHTVDRQRAQHLRRRTPHPARRALREDPPFRPHAHRRRRRHQQRDERE